MMLYSKKKIPSGGKVDLKNLSEFARLHLSNAAEFGKDIALYYMEKDGFTFDFLWHPKPDSDCLFVLFSGDALRKKLDPPVFQRWKWAHLFPGHCLYVSDPSLHLYERLGLAWYAGTSRFDPAPVIADIVQRVARQLGIKDERVWTYGSSGGGFAALRMLEFLPKAGAVSVNPQTNIVAYSAKSVELFLRICFEKRSREQVLQEFPRRISLLSQPAVFQDRSIIYLQNTVDTHHYEDHYLPFCKALGIQPLQADAPDLTEDRHGNFLSVHFHHPEGHKKGETPDAFNRAVAAAQAWVPEKPARVTLGATP